jgi:hypothetical protein
VRLSRVAVTELYTDILPANQTHNAGQIRLQTASGIPNIPLEKTTVDDVPVESECI